MISLSQDWAIISQALYSREYADELAELLKKHNVKSILECGCGNGNILHELAQRGFSGVGIDSCQEMISLANTNHSHPSLEYRLLDWVQLNLISEQFDALICRGNSLAAATSWNLSPSQFHTFSPEEAREEIQESIRLFFQKIKKRGLLYVDYPANLEAEYQELSLQTQNINVRGLLVHNKKRKTRVVTGGGIINNEFFFNSSITYLWSSKELEQMIQAQFPEQVFHPKLEHEPYYHPVCAIK